MHANQPSISYEKVGLARARSVISAARVVGNDGSKFIPPLRRRNSLREGFSDKRSEH